MTYRISFRFKSDSKDGYCFYTNYTFSGFTSNFMAKTSAIGWYLIHAQKEGFRENLTGLVDITNTIELDGDKQEVVEVIDIKNLIKEFIKHETIYS